MCLYVCVDALQLWLAHPLVGEGGGGDEGYHPSAVLDLAAPACQLHLPLIAASYVPHIRSGSLSEVSALLLPHKKRTMYEAVSAEMDKYWKIAREAEYIARMRALSAARGRRTLLQELLCERDENGDTPLRLACALGDVPIVRLLLALGADTEDAGTGP